MSVRVTEWSHDLTCMHIVQRITSRWLSTSDLGPYHYISFSSLLNFLYEKQNVKTIINPQVLLFFQISCEESHSVETVRGPQLQYGNGTYSIDHGQETAMRTAEFSSGTYVNDTENWMTGSYNGTDLNHTGTSRIGVSGGSKGIRYVVGRVGGNNAKHHGNYRWRLREWNCNTTCPNNTSTGRPAACNRTCTNRMCG